MNFNLKQLEVFAAVVECKSFTAAAEKLYLAQSTVSGHVAALEKECGVPVFIRTGKRKILLTEAGQKIYAHARAVLQSCEDLARELQEHTAFELVLAASTIPMQYRLPAVLAGYKKKQPDCLFTLKSGDSAAVHKMILEGEAQIGFAGGMFNRKEVCYDLLWEDRLVLITPDTEFFREKQAKGAVGNDLLSEPLIFREAGSGTQQAADRFLCENNISPERIHMAARMDNSEAILNSVALGIGSAIVSGMAAAGAANVLKFSLTGKSTERSLYMIRPKGRHLTTGARQFFKYIKCEMTPASIGGE